MHPPVILVSNSILTKRKYLGSNSWHAIMDNLNIDIYVEEIVGIVEL